jgi:hypothetical protein
MTKETNTKVPPEENPERDYGRKPYYEEPRIEGLPFRQAVRSGSPDGGSYGAMMSRKNYRYSKQFNLEHSQFKKPYMDEEFPEMEGFNDYLQLIPYDDWEITFEVETPPGEGSVPGYCFAVCQILTGGTEWNEDCSELKAYFPTEASDTGGLVYPVSSSHPVAKQTSGEFFGSSYYPQVFVFTVEDSGPVIATFFQATYEVCPGLREGSCRIDINESADCCTVEWDLDNSDETVLRSGSATLIVIGGDGADYSWSLDQTNGSGFSLSSASTTTPTNTLNAAVDACGSCTITVTSCDDSTDGYVRCSSVGAGVWASDAAWFTLADMLANSKVTGAGAWEDTAKDATAIWVKHAQGGYQLWEGMRLRGLYNFLNPATCRTESFQDIANAVLWDTTDCATIGTYDSKDTHCCTSRDQMSCVKPGSDCLDPGKQYTAYYLVEEWRQYKWICP